MAQQKVPQSARLSAGGVQSLFGECPNVGGRQTKWVFSKFLWWKKEVCLRKAISFFPSRRRLCSFVPDIVRKEILSAQKSIVFLFRFFLSAAGRDIVAHFHVNVSNLRWCTSPLSLHVRMRSCAAFEREALVRRRRSCAVPPPESQSEAAILQKGAFKENSSRLCFLYSEAPKTLFIR